MEEKLGDIDDLWDTVDESQVKSSFNNNLRPLFMTPQERMIEEYMAKENKKQKDLLANLSNNTEELGSKKRKRDEQSLYLNLILINMYNR